MRVLDLFSGIGLMSLGLSWAGMRTVGFCEIEPACRFWLGHNFPGVPIWTDVRELTAEAVHERCGSVDLLAGGFPCQPVSVAGKRKGAADERWLWPEMFRLVRELRPRWVLAENVPGLRTLGADRVLEDLGSEGYACWPLVVGADDCGAPHRRKRVWVVARLRLADRDGEREGDADEPGRIERARWPGAADAGWRGEALAHGHGHGHGLEGERSGGVLHGERAASWDDAHGCGEWAVGDADSARRAAAERGHSLDAGREPEPGCGAVVHASGEGLEGRRALPVSAPPEVSVLACAGAGKQDPTRVRGVVSRPGEAQHGWEAPRLAYSASREVRGAGLAREGTDSREPESRVGRPVDGSARRLARHRSAARRARLKAWGNGVYAPLVAEIGTAILRAEEL